MKKPIILLLTILTLLLFSNTLIGQNDSDVTPIEGDNNSMERFHELGINATGFINEFISLNSNDSDVGNYMITYKYHIGKNALRFGVGGRYSQLDEGINGSGNRNTSDQAISVRAGYEWYTNITKRWGFYYGFDAIAGTSISTSISNTFEEVELTNSTTSFGGGGILGVQFFLNSRISLATEGSLYYDHSIIKNKEIFSINSEFDVNTTNTKDAVNFGLPTSLFLIIRF